MDTTIIVEYISEDKIVTSRANKERFENPRVGDVIDFGDMVGTYPFMQKFGRVESFDFWFTGSISICCEMGSCFLGEEYVSISGGPFSTILMSELKPTYKTKITRVWNWGKNYPGAGKGIEYMIVRPIFEFVRTPESAEEIKRAFERI